jgi:hypothetical protein
MNQPLPGHSPATRRYAALLDLVDRTYGPLADQRAPARYRLWPLPESAAAAARRPLA